VNPDRRLPRRIAHRAWRELRGYWPALRDAPAILMYHRVGEPPWDPWALCIPPCVFREQLRELTRRRTIVSMEELASGLQAGRVPPRATALTFDDGYADNIQVAAPILEDFGAPATFFLTSAFVSGGERFWWDELARIVLGGREAADFTLEVDGTKLAAAWPVQHELPQDLPTWRVGRPSSDPRRFAYERLWNALRSMGETARRTALEALVAATGEEAPLADDPLGAPMNSQMIRSAPKLVSFGAHGRSHIPLTALPPAERRTELELARREVAALTGGAPPDGMAYPHGSFDDETRALVAAAGYEWAVTSRSARVDQRRCDPLALPRLELGYRSGRAMWRALHAAGR
jgi:peptidoglycan/xylan/chitin deacetylase (PgdA/CDA1 family)